MAGFALAGFYGLLDVVDEEMLVLVAGHTGKRRVLAVCELVRPRHESESGACETSML